MKHYTHVVVVFLTAMTEEYGRLGCDALSEEHIASIFRVEEEAV
jgi:hypothetical protein